MAENAIDNPSGNDIENLRGSESDIASDDDPDLGASQDLLEIRRITVRTGRLVCDVAVRNTAYRQTTPRLASFITRHHPDLPLHACVNEVGAAFGSVIEHTSVPHMLEHLAIDIQAYNTSSPSSTFVGTTEWTDFDAGEARIEISFHDDLEALRAFSEAAQFLNMAMVTCFV